MQYLRAYEYVFENPKWLKNVLLCTVCAIIPVVGMIVLMGYLCDVFDALRRREATGYPDFDFGRFGEYLTRGVWVFLVAFVVSLASLPVMGVGMLILFLTMAAAAQALPIVVACGIAFGALFFFVIAILLNAVVEPIVIRAILLRGFTEAFSWKFIADFAKRMFWQIILVQLFLMVSAIAWMIFGLLLLCVGVYFVMPVVMYAQFHLHYQLYEEYLRRGGMEARA